VGRKPARAGKHRPWKNGCINLLLIQQFVSILVLAIFSSRFRIVSGVRRNKGYSRVVFAQQTAAGKLAARAITAASCAKARTVGENGWF
jgi:hypothetical protein